MMDLNNKVAVSIDEHNSDFNDPYKHHGQKRESYSTVQSKLNPQQNNDIQRISTQTESHVCIVQKIITRFEFRNIDFNPTFYHSKSLMAGCDSSFTGYQYNPKQYHMSSIQRPVCGKIYDSTTPTTSIKSKGPTVKSNYVTFKDISQKKRKVKEYSVSFTDSTYGPSSDEARKDIINFFYQNIKGKKKGEYDNFDAPQYFWHGSDSLSDPAVDMKFDGSRETWTVVVTKYSQNLDWAMWYTWGKKNRIVVIKAKKIPHTFKDIEFHHNSGYSSDNTKVVARYDYNLDPALNMNKEAKKKGFNLAKMKSKYHIPKNNNFTYPDAWIFMRNAVTNFQLTVDTVFHLEYKYGYGGYGSSSSSSGARKSIDTHFLGWITSNGIVVRKRKSNAHITSSADFTDAFADSSPRSNVLDLSAKVVTVSCIIVSLFG